MKQSGNEARAPKENQDANLEDASSVQTHDPGALEIPTLTRVWPTNNNVGISGLCHVLLFYGIGPTDLPSFAHGDLALKALTDEQAAVKTFGKSPFIRTRNGLRYLLSNDPVFHTDVGESHQDQCLATFAALNLPLDTPVRLKSSSYSISDLLSESVSNFSFDQKELAWTAIAYARYLPPQKEWKNRFRERTSFSQLVHHLLQLDLNSQSCVGTHIFQALAKIEEADRRHSILDGKTQKQLDSYLVNKLYEVVQRQQKDGSWNKQWCDSIHADETGQKTPLQSGILVTGHLLEVLNSLDAERRLPNAAYLRAAEWLEQALSSKEIRADGTLICPFTHAARVAREILASSRTNSPRAWRNFILRQLRPTSARVLTAPTTNQCRWRRHRRRDRPFISGSLDSQNTPDVWEKEALECV